MTDQSMLDQIAQNLARIADGIETIARDKSPAALTLTEADAYHWDELENVLTPVPDVNRIPLSLLQGIDATADTLLRNTTQFARGLGANNALLWGARGMGKSSLVKAVHAEVAALPGADKRLILVEISREDLGSLPRLMRELTRRDERYLLFCDDLSFDKDETSYKSLKTVLDGGLEGRSVNTLFYATSNRRHLMPRDMIDNERSTAINPSEAVEEKISLSDRFGLWLGFHNCDQATYLEMIQRYVEYYKIAVEPDVLRARAIEWAAIRGARSGRVAIQFIRQLAGETGRAV